MQRDGITGTHGAEDLEALDRGLKDGGVDRPTRRRLLGGAAAGVAATGMLGLPSAAFARDEDEWDAAIDRIASVLATAESFGVTFLTEAVKRAPGTPSAQFLDVLKAANTAEFDHIAALRQIGGKRLVDRFWIPDAAFGGGGAGLFASIEAVENIEISAYLIAVTRYARASRARPARVVAAAMGTEAEHRVLARAAQNMLGKPVGVPNNKSFESVVARTSRAHVHLLEGLGIGFDEKGAEPGKFYEFPGDPVANGVGLDIEQRRPN